MPIQNYVNIVKKRYDSGISTEHSYRGDLQNLLQELAKGFTITNEPKRQKCGAPDFIVQNKEVPIGYIEAKDIGENLHVLNKSDLEQRNRYIASLDNIIFTDYLEFQFYKYGQKVKEIKIASIENNKVKPVKENFDLFITYIKDFCEFQGQTIKSSEKLAKMMAQKARMMEEVIYNAVKIDDGDNTLKDQLKAFKLILIHDLDEKTFADIYAQTIAYGLFAARLHDETLDDFSRQEARELIPRSNPFLRNLFDYISGAQLDERVVWIVNDLADIFRATDVKELMEDFGKSTQQNDPFIHFYETFLGEYDPALRKSRGVYYTPEPVVNFIVRAVDDILKTEFNITDGLADISKVKRQRVAVGYGSKKGADVFEDIELHKVQILDPATGTGTFLAEVVKQIYKKFEGQEGIWSNYVENHLIPRINGFEILMASYSMCHLKLEMLLKETKYKPKNDKSQPRLRVFLTNSLEEVDPNTGNVFASWLSNEATEANLVKRDTPVMVILGNPPYSGESSNKGEWIMGIMEDYKKEPGGKEKLREKNPKWINDDYVKFLRYGQFFIEKNGEGILAFINPHGYLDNPTFRGMRWNLLKTYDKIYTIDLHGNSKKKEISPDGSVDQNIFDIMQGVSINIFVKTNKKKSNELGKVFHSELFGKREMKYNFLLANSLNTINYKELQNVAPNYFFVNKDINIQNEFEKGFRLNELMQINVLGFQTHRDKFAVDINLDTLIKRIKDFRDNEINDSELKERYSINESNDWTLNKQRAILKKDSHYLKHISLTAYRPFDNQYTILHPAICDRPRKEIIQHVLNKDNYCLLNSKQQAVEGFRHTFITKLPANDCVMSTTSREANQIFPLYLYDETNEQLTIDQSTERKPNLNTEIVKQISEDLDLTFTNEKNNNQNTFAPIDILDYIYSVLHSPSYRDKYKESLKINFPKIPYPKDTDYFWRMVEFGKQIREIHLLESTLVQNYITKYPIDGDNEVTNICYQNNRVKINDVQYFDGVPKIAWEFYIGGYQPAQKWLKDRKGKVLSFEDVQHYRKIIVALIETDRLMKEVDKIIEIDNKKTN